MAHRCLANLRQVAGLLRFLAQRPLVARGDHDERHENRQRDEGQRQDGGPRGLAPAPLDQPAQRTEPPGGDRLAVEIALQVVRQVAGRGVAPPRVLFQTFETNRLQIDVDGRVEQPRRERLLLGDEVDRRQSRGPREGRPAREQLVQDRPEAVDVGGRAKVLTSRRLLGRHVARRAQDGAGPRPARVGIDDLGQAEVGHLRPIVLVEQHVAGLEVAMNNPAAVGIMHGPRRGLEVDRCPPAGQRSQGGALGEAGAADVLHREVRLAIVGADLVQRDDVGVLQLRRGGGLVLEAVQIVRPGQRPADDHFQRDDAAEPQVPRLEHHAHAAAADFFDELIIRQTGLRHRLWRRGCGRHDIVGSQRLGQGAQRQRHAPLGQRSLCVEIVRAQVAGYRIAHTTSARDPFILARRRDGVNGRVVSGER